MEKLITIKNTNGTFTFLANLPKIKKQMEEVYDLDMSDTTMIEIVLEDEYNIGEEWREELAEEIEGMMY